MFEMKKRNRRVGSRTKEQYRAPKVTTVTHEQAKKLVIDGTNRSDEEADKVLQSLREELRGMARRDKKAS